MANILDILITARDEASAVIQAAAASATEASAEVNKANAALSKVGSSLSSVGMSMTASITLPILAIGAESTKMALGFAKQMELLHTSAGVPQSAIQGLSNTVLGMAGEVAQAPEALAQGLYHVASAGVGIWSTSQQLDILKTAAEGANIGMANLDDTTYALTSAMASGVTGAKSASDMMATLTAIVGAGDMKMQDLNGALSTGILSTAATFGISIQSVGAALATLTDNGEQADEAATRLRMTIALMSSPSSTAAKQLQALGLTAEDANKATADMNKVFAQSGLTTTKLADDLRQPNGITVAMKDLKTHLEDAGLSASETDAMLSKAFGGGRTDAALLTMLQNTDRLDAKYQAITTGAGQFQSKLQDLENTPQYKIQQAWDLMQSSLIKIGGDLLPTVASNVQNIANVVSDATTWWGKLDPVARDALEYIGGALAISGPILMGLGAMIKGAQDAKTAFGFIGDVTGTVVDGIAKWGPAGADAAKDFGSHAADMLSAGKDTAGGLVTKAAESAKAWVSAAADTASAWATKVGEITKTVITEGPKIALHALDASVAWILNGIRIGIVWAESMAVIVAKSAWAAITGTPSAIAAGAAWVKSAALSSFAWVTVELPKIVTGFITTSRAAVVNGATSSVAWVKNAAISSFAWVTTELPKIVLGFITTSAAALVNAAASSVAWVKNAAITSAIWAVTELPKIVAGFVAVAASAVVQAAAASKSWVAGAAAASEAYGAFSTLLATPLVMPAIVVTAALFAISQVWDAYNQMESAISGLDKSEKDLTNTTTQVDNEMIALVKAGQGPVSNDAKAAAARAQTYLHNQHVAGYATGGYTGQGNAGDVAGIVHKGEYVVPKDQVDQNTGKPKMGGDMYNTFHVYNQMDLTRATTELGFTMRRRAA